MSYLIYIGSYNEDTSSPYTFTHKKSYKIFKTESYPISSGIRRKDDTYVMDDHGNLLFFPIKDEGFIPLEDYREERINCILEI